jgi:hypothetical protein
MHQHRDANAMAGTFFILALFLAATAGALRSSAAAGEALDPVDFRYSPPEWQTAICLPDDPYKTLVDKSGELLYGYGLGGREFATRIGVEVTGGAVWTKQELVSPRVPIVRTYRSAGGLEILEDAFAVADLPQPAAKASAVRRVDGGGVNRRWASPGGEVLSSLADIAVHMGGSIRCEVPVPAGEARRIALALCEGWWGEAGHRIQVLSVEGAQPRTVDTVKDIGKNRAAAYWFDGRDADRDGKIDVAVDAAPEATDKNTFLNGLWVFPAGFETDGAALLSGRLESGAPPPPAHASRGGPARNDVILVRVENRGDRPVRIEPRLIVDTTLPFDLRPDGRAVIDGHDVVTATLKMVGSPEVKGSRRAIPLEGRSLAAGETFQFSVLHAGGGSIVLEPATVEAAAACRSRVRSYWENASLPYGSIEVPDAGIQALVDSSIRNIWQAREVHGGIPVFQVGPTCYRGLWVVDGAFLLEAAAIVGAGKEARSAIAYTLGQQKPTGAFEILSPRFYKENGIVLWTCVRHARLTRDRAWLESVWPKLERAAGYIQELRKLSLEDKSPLDDGINPPGEIDGGLSGAGTGFKRPEFSNVHWNLLGLKALVDAAAWLGKTEAGARWKTEYEDLYATFREAAARDTFKDPKGNPYTPIFMGNEGSELPQRGQWTFCHAVYPGGIFPKDDPMVAGTLAMLEATERQGMVYGTGWDATGIWNYFASFYAHALLWQGNGRKAAQVLRAYANHASPTLVWREEQSLKGQPFRKVGDMPHNWASAEFIRLTVHLLALDRGDELHLLEGFPREWAGPLETTRLRGIATPFGPLDMTVAADPEGKTATIEVKPLADDCRAVIVHLPDGSTARIDPRAGGKVSFAVSGGGR